MSEHRRVRLEIRGRQTDPDGNTQENTAVYRAEQVPAEGGRLFRYRDGEEDAELYVSRSLVRMERGKLSGTRMLFDPSVPFIRCAYRTPYGTIPMEIRTDRIAVLDGGSGPGQTLRARVRYTLKMDEAYSLQCSVTVRADPEPEGPKT